jgi:hypothetical protein
MTEKKIIAVVGATGQQGGGLARAILDDPGGEFAVRAVTRKPGSEPAKALAARGAEIVTADLDDEASVLKALEGAHGAFFVTAFWEYVSVERERAHARAMANAAKAAGVKHVVWSTLPDTRAYIPLDDDRVPTLEGRYHCPEPLRDYARPAAGQADETGANRGHQARPAPGRQPGLPVRLLVRPLVRRSNSMTAFSASPCVPRVSASAPRCASAGAIVCPRSYSSTTRGSTYEARATAGVLPRYSATSVITRDTARF